MHYFFFLLYFKLLFIFIISGTFCLLYFKLILLFFYLFYVFSGAFSFALF